MMHPSLESWRNACTTMKNQKRRLGCYIQWYPFSLLGPSDWRTLSSECFYDTYIKDGSFIVCTFMNYRTKGYIQKQGIVFRDSVLVAPVLFLYLLAFGIEYEKSFADVRHNSACEYAGNLGKMQAQYKHSYRRHCDAKRIAKAEFDYCLKTDITNFFGSINVDRLLSKMQDRSGGNFTVADGLFLKALLLYCGEGKFPTVQGHPTLSYLATKVFLSDVDCLLSTYLDNSPAVSKYRLIRYVDDLYIFLSFTDDTAPHKSGHEILSKYADLLRANGLMLNQGKVKFMPTSEISLAETSESCVDYTGCYAAERVDNAVSRLTNLFGQIAERAVDGYYQQSDFDDALKASFASEDNRIQPEALFRQCLYEEKEAFRDRSVIEAISNALRNGATSLSYCTDELTKCILNTHNEKLIKRLLALLFEANRHGSWSSIESLIALGYLIARGTRHQDLLKTIREAEPGLYSFIYRYCKSNSFAVNPTSKFEDKLLAVTKDDAVSSFLYASYLQHGSTSNSFEQFGFIRSYFDRFTTNYKRRVQGTRQRDWMFKVNDIADVYSFIEGARETVGKAEKLRRENPLVHAGSQLVRGTYRNEIDEIILSLIKLMAESLSEITIEQIDVTKPIPAR